MANELEKYYKEYYTKYGKNAYEMGRVTHTGRIDALCEYIQTHVPPGSLILDVGCGDMHLSTLLPKYVFQGVDINTDRAKGLATAHDLMVSPYPFRDNSFDAVVCSEVLEHLWDLRVVHKEVKRVVKRGGMYLVSTPNHDYLDHHLEGFRHLLFDAKVPHLMEHIRFYNFAVHKKYLNEAGFQVQEHMGADSQYSAVFYAATQVLMEQAKLNFSEADRVVGKMFPSLCHTVIIRSTSI